MSHVSLPASSQHSSFRPLDTCCMESVRYLWRRDLVALVEPHETCGNVAASMESHGERAVQTWQLPWSPMARSVLDAGLVQCLDSWPRMQWCATFRQCNDSCQRMQWCARSVIVTTAVVSVLISGGLRRMVSEVFGKHFGSVYSWSTMSSSFVSCLAQCLHR